MLHEARPLLLDLNPNPERSAIIGDVADYVAAHCTVRQWRLPVLGWCPVPRALLVRPDGYITWASADGSSDGLQEAAEQIGTAAAGSTMLEADSNRIGTR